MMPSMKLKTAPVTSSQPPHSNRLARTDPVRAVRRVNQSPATSPINAAGSNQEASVPIDAPNNRVRPGSPPKNRFAPPPGPPPGPPPPGPPTASSPPVTR